MHSEMVRSRAMVFFSLFFGFVLLSAGLILRQGLSFCSCDYARSSIFTLPSHLCFTSLTLVGKAYLFPTSSRKIPELRFIGSDGPKLTNVTWSVGHYTPSGPAWLTFFSLELYGESSPPRPKLTENGGNSPPRENEEGVSWRWEVNTSQARTSVH